MMQPPYEGNVGPTGSNLPPNPGTWTALQGWNTWQTYCGQVLAQAMTELATLPLYQGIIL